MNDQEKLELGTSISQYYRDAATQRDDSNPLMRPAILDELPPTNPAQLLAFNAKFAEAESGYFERLMKRGHLSAAEIKTLGAAVARYLKSAK
jgi:hypothetical protein